MSAAQDKVDEPVLSRVCAWCLGRGFVDCVTNGREHTEPCGHCGATGAGTNVAAIRILVERATRAERERDEARAARSELCRLAQAVVDADDAIEELKAERKRGVIVHSRAWRKAYAKRENADRALWGTHADDRAAAARRLVAFLPQKPSATDDLDVPG